MPLTITTFNIQTFGLGRAKQQDRLTQVAYAMNFMVPKPDIIGLVEITESKPYNACLVAQKLCDKMRKLDSYEGPGRDYNYIITFYNKFETYVFLYNPNTVNPLVIEEDDYKYYTIDDKQSEIHIKLDEADFKEISKKNSTVNKKGAYDKVSIENVFPLLHFKDRNFCRPPGLGIFKHGNKYVGVALWHNMSGNDSPAYSFMLNLAKSDLVTKQSFTIKSGNNTIQIKNLCVTGDFNVDLIEAEEHDNDPYGEFVKSNMKICVKGNEALSYLNDYNYKWDYPNSHPIYTVAFDNTIFRCPDYQFDKGFINPHVSNLISAKDFIMNFLKNSEFMSCEEGFDPDDDFDYEEGEKPEDRFQKYLEDKLYRYKNKKKPKYNPYQRKVIVEEFMKNRTELRNNKTGSLVQTKIILGEVFSSFFSEAYEVYASTNEFRQVRYKQLLERNETLKYSDVVFFLRQFISDHLPVTITFK